MLKRIWDKIKDGLLPGEESQDQKSTTSGKRDRGGRRRNSGYRQMLLDRIEEQFLQSLDDETTSESLLYHTSFTVYVSESEYERLSPSFITTVNDAVKVFMKHLREEVKQIDNYKNHSKCWVMQLVCIPEDAAIDGIDPEVMKENPIIIRSKLFPDNVGDNSEPDNRMVGGGLYKTTIHTKNSQKALPQAFNMAAFSGLTELDKDKYRVEFSFKDKTEAQSMADQTSTSTASTAAKDAYALIKMDDGNLIKGNQRYKGFYMTRNKLWVSGKNGSVAKSGEDEIHIDDDSVSNPTLEITRDPQTGRFTVKAWGDVRVAGKNVKSNTEMNLPDNTNIMINGDYQINFEILKK